MTKFFGIIILILLSVSACEGDFPIVEDFEGKSFSLLNQDSASVDFPEYISGKIGVVGYIFTNCPDICPLTTNNMRMIQERAKKEGLSEIEFVSISFDPDVDKPRVLKKYMELRRLDKSNWDFLTGETEIIASLMKEVGVFAFPSDSAILNSGKKIYFYVHTDRISLFDRKGKIRKNYLGSEINIEEIIADLKKIKDL